MDAAIISQVSNLLRCAGAFIVIYVVVPTIILPTSKGSIPERFFTQFIRMVALTIIVGYLLVVLKLYEVLSLVFVFFCIAIIVKVPLQDLTHRFRKTSRSLFALFYDSLDNPLHFLGLIKQHFRKIFEVAKRKKYPVSLNERYQAALLLCILAFSTYLRFYDTLSHAAPAMSDAYVVLAWMKYISGRILFHDGIYPEGFFIYLSFLHKFSGSDALYILKYTGPLHGVLTTMGIYFFVEKLTGHKLPGILSAFVFGVLGAFLPYAWDRQGATLPQEFALVFLFPAWYYTIAFLQTRQKPYLWTAAAAFAVIALSHSLILLFLWVGLVCILGSWLVFNYNEKGNKPVKALILAVILTGTIGAIPLIGGVLAGKSFHGASLEFALQYMNIGFPKITLLDKLAMIGILAFLVSNQWQKDNSKKIVAWMVFFLGVLSMVMYFYLAPISSNALLVSRTSLLWSLVTAVGIGVGAEPILRLLMSRTSAPFISTSIVCLIMIAAVVISKPLPALPYKLQYDMEINQYLRITKEFPPAEWTLVSTNEGYDLALGKGWHINLSDFLSWYDPQKRSLSRTVEGKEEPLVGNHIFIFHQKKLFFVNIKEMEEIMVQRATDYAKLEQWVTNYRETHNDLSVFYEDDFIAIYLIQRG